MPRRLPVKADRFIGNLFIILVFATLFLVYVAVVVYSLGPLFLKSIIATIAMGFFHFLFIMVTWCLMMTILGDPGQVPTFWGFHFGDHESKRKRYWLMWNVFKPERTHHWSTCNRWVLNMDHHCPWVNNCIGFWNRKQFVLLLVYVLFSAYFSAITLLIDLWYRLPAHYEQFNKSRDSYDGFSQLLVLIPACVITCSASYIMTNFLKFHIELILQNKTTIEFLEKKGEHFESQYNINPMHNWRQVFGYNVILWFFPVSWASGHPIGDGVYWQINPDVKVPDKRSSKANQNQNQQDGQSQNSENKRLILDNNSHQVDPENNPNSQVIFLNSLKLNMFI